MPLRDGVTTKLHLASNTNGLPVRAEMKGVEVLDYKGFALLVDDDLPRGKVVSANRGSESDHIRSVIACRGETRVINDKANFKVLVHVDAMTYTPREIALMGVSINSNVHAAS